MGVAEQYAKPPMGALPGHKFAEHVAQGEDLKSMTEVSKDKRLEYLPGVFVGGYIYLATPTPQEHMMHVENVDGTLFNPLDSPLDGINIVVQILISIEVRLFQ